MEFLKSATNTVRKRCLKCGRAGYYRPRERRCKQTGVNQFGAPTAYLCYGDLQLAPIKRTTTSKSAHEVAERKAAEFRKELERKQEDIRDWTAKIARAHKRIAELESKIKYYDRRGEELKAQANQITKGVRRAMALPVKEAV